MAHVLIVDNDTSLLHIMQLILKRAGYTTMTANSADEALSRLADYYPDIVLTDYHMPGMTGGELTRRLKTDTATRSIPVMLYSSAIDSIPDDTLRLCDAVLRKPVAPTLLISTTEKLLKASV